MFNVKEYFKNIFNKLFKKKVKKEVIPEPIVEEVITEVDDKPIIIPEDIKRKISQAKVDLTLKYPWWAVLVLRLELIEDPIKAKNTMSTDGRYIYYTNEFINSLTNEELIGVLVHEALHCGFLHITRMGERERGKWNAATDYAINGIVIDSGQEMPGWVLHDEQYKGMTADEIYPLMPEKFKDPKWGFIVDPDGKGRELTDEEKDQWRDALAHAVNELRKRGKLKGDAWDRMIEKAMAPAVPWKALLASLIKATVGQEDYTWKKPSRRSHLVGVHLPGRFENTLPPIGIAIDSSGSIGSTELSEAVALVRGVAEELRIDKIIVVEADDDVRNVTELFTYDEWNPSNVKGGGGTSFIPAIEQLDRDECSVIIYITDLEGDFPPSAPVTPVIWLTKSNSPVPFGQVVKID